tara:strand:- start:3156 stop:6380 length:3225 start_codon:yes stop_codon:yes gene_type:complete
MAGELTIEQNSDGTATINFEGGGQHTVGQPGDNIADNVAALQSAYGDRIGEVIEGDQTYQSQTGQDPVDTTTESQGWSMPEERVYQTTIDGVGIPTWVNAGYIDSYVASVKAGKPRKPNMREMMEALSGQSVESLYGSGQDYSQIVQTASNLLHGSVGSNQETRNWDIIMEAAKTPGTNVIDPERLEAAASLATAQMYGGYDIQYANMGGSDVLQVFSQANGNLITTIQPNNNDWDLRNGSGFGRMRSFGIQGDIIRAAMPPEIQEKYGVYLKAYDEVYNPWWDSYKDLMDVNFLAEFNMPQITNNQTDNQVVNQTITADSGSGTASVDSGTGTTQQDTGGQTTQAVNETTYTPDNTGTTTTPLPGVSSGSQNLGGASTGTYPQANITGTMQVGTQTGNLSSTPDSVTTMNNYTGTNPTNLTSQSQQGFGGQATYSNQFGQQITVTEDASGNALTYVPPGFDKVGAARGGVMAMNEGGDVQLARKFLGFDGPSNQLTNFLAANPAAAARMGKYQQAMSGMAQNRVGAQDGTTGTSLEDFQRMQQNLVTQTMQPIQGAVNYLQPAQADFIGQNAGQVYDVANMANAATAGSVSQVGMPKLPDKVETISPEKSFTDVKKQTDDLTAQTGDPTKVVTGQTSTSSMVGNLDPKTSQSIDVTNAPTRTLQTGPQGELISGSAVDQAKVGQAFGTGEVQAASMQDELATLMQQFEGGNTPAWAAGSMRKATAIMAERGIGASSMAGQAIIQAAMEAALPIAQIDTANKQQAALFKAEQRAKFLGQEFDQEFQTRVMNAAKVSEIANMQFSADQQIALENSRAANTMELQNLNNRQALIMAEAASLSQLDVANLNNRQQAQVANAQNFLQMDMANLSNEQQAEIFRIQSNIQSILSDQAAVNASEQFNATSENQTDQFFANLAANVGQFNASQSNAMDQFNINTVNALRQFNAETQNQRDMFNAQNGLVVAQANAQWRQNIATLNNAAQNESNMDFAKTINALTSKNLDEIWQRERDNMSFAFTSSETAMDRALKIVLADKELESVRTQLAAQEDAAKTSLMFRFLFGTATKGLLGGVLPI